MGEIVSTGEAAPNWGPLGGEIVSTGEAVIVAFQPDAIFFEGRMQRGPALAVRDGKVVSVGPVPAGARVERLAGRALLPGLVNAHSHAFQRVLRGRTEWLEPGREADDFWTWREQMYRAAEALSPEEIEAVSRMAFLEMALAGITSVGEFHYLHRDPHGRAYADPNEIAKRVIRAAREVGLRIGLLRVAYARSGFRLPPNPRQARFIDPSVDAYLGAVDRLRPALDGAHAWLGVAPHSVRAAPRDWLEALAAYARGLAMPFHIHLAEQPKEIAACAEEHGRRPAELLLELGAVDARFTGVHGVHLLPEEIRRLGAAGATLCACPTTERNLGDGVVDVQALLDAGARVAVGTDSQAQIDLLEDARELEYHLRLQRLRRAVLAPKEHAGSRAALAARLFACATLHGARSIGAGSGELEPGASADFFCVDLADPSIAGARGDDLLPAIVFSLSRSAIREVAVTGAWVVREGRHARQDEIVREFEGVQDRLWRSA